ncbi:MAG: GNAT family N-acetyltransferase [Candidatus Omnitrophota bacterium]
MNDTKAVIRKYCSSDRQRVRQICFNTAFFGQPCSNFFDGDDIFADALTGYFTDYESQSCFVAEKNGEVVGYLIGAKDVRQMEKIFAKKIMLKLLVKAFSSGVLFKFKNIVFIGSCFGSMLKGEFRQPLVAHEYPATLHINMHPDFRNLGIGSQLIARYLAYLKDEGVTAVHFATMSDKAAQFFNKQGFVVLSRTQRSYFRYLLHRDFFVYIYGKKIKYS